MTVELLVDLIIKNMEKIVEKVKNLSFDLRYISDLASSIPNCLRADLGELNFEVNSEFREIIKKKSEQADFSYAPTYGDPSLINTLSNFESKTLSNITNPKILVTSGGQAALFASLSSLLRPGDKILTDKFYYPPYSNLSKLVEGSLINHDLENIDNINLNGVKVLLLNSPNNPTGKIYDENALNKLSKLAQKNDWIIIEDAVYNRIYYNNPPLSIAAFCPDRTLVLNSASKNFCIPGVRLGWLIGPSNLITEIAKMHRNMNSCPNTFFQKVMAEFIPLSSDFFVDLRKEMKARRDLIKKIIKELGWQYIDAQGGIYLMVKVPEVTDSLGFVERLIREVNISVMPGKFFGGHEQYLRICYGALNKEQINDLGTRLKNFVG